MKKPELSIIIPVLNEEKIIGKLLDSIRKQNFPCEIIVADGGSTDKTIKIARKFKARIVNVPKPGCPAKGRNYGAEAAKSDLLLFFDADISFKKNFLRDCVNEIKRKKLGAATCYARPSGNNVFDYISYELGNAWIRFFKTIKPYAHGFCIFAGKKTHNRIKGFNEKLKFGEDSDYVTRASKITKFDVLEKVIYTSVRRFETEGRLRVTLRYFYYNLHRLLIGELKKVEYEFGHYK